MSNANPIRVMLVDDHAVVRSGLDKRIYRSDKLFKNAVAISARCT